MTERAAFEVEVVDKASGPTAKMAGETRALNAALGELSGATVQVTLKQSKLDKALKGAQLVYYGAQAVEVGKRVWDSVGGFDGMKSAAQRAGRALAGFGRGLVATGKRLAPFAIGGAGLYGIGKVATSVAIPALGATAVGLAAVSAAAAAATIGVGLLVAKLAMMTAGKLASFATFAQDTKFAMGNLAKGGANADKMFTHAVGLAAEFGLNVKDTTKQWAKFLALQFKPKEADKMIKMGADLQALGTTAEQVEGVFMALGQIKGKGRLQAEEMLQLAERGISTVLVVEEIGKILGKTNDQVRKLQEAGKVSADVGLLAIERAINRKLGQSELGESGKRFANETITGMVNQIKARADIVGLALGQKLVPALSKVSRNILDRFETFIVSDKATTLIDKLGVTFEQLGNVAVNAMPLVQAFFGAFTDRGIEAIGELNAVLGQAGKADSAALAKGVAEFGRGLADIVIFGGKVIGVVGAIGAAFVALGKWGPIAVNAVTNPVIGIPQLFGATAEAIWAKLDGFGPRLYQAGTDLMVGLANGIKAGLMWPVNAIGEVGDAVVGKLRQVWDSHSPSRVGDAIGFSLPQGMGGGIGRGAPIAIGAAAMMAAATVGAAEQGLHAAPTAMPVTAEREYNLGPALSIPRSDVMVGGAGSGFMAALAGGSLPPFQLTQNFEGVLEPEQAAELSERGVRRAIDAYFRSL